MRVQQSLREEEIDIAHAIKYSASDPDAFKPIYEAYFPRVYRYCLRRIGNVEEAEDLTSLIFMRALSNIAGYQGGSFPAWLFRIAHNVLANHLRNQPMTISLESIELLGTEDDPLENVIQKEEHQQVIRLLSGLSDEQQNLLSLRIAARLSAKEIGMITGKSEGAVRIAIYRIIRQLRATWSKEEKW